MDNSCCFFINFFFSSFVNFYNFDWSPTLKDKKDWSHNLFCQKKKQKMVGTWACKSPCSSLGHRFYLSHLGPGQSTQYTFERELVTKFGCFWLRPKKTKKVIKENLRLCAIHLIGKKKKNQSRHAYYIIKKKCITGGSYFATCEITEFVFFCANILPPVAPWIHQRSHMGRPKSNSWPPKTGRFLCSISWPTLFAGSTNILKLIVRVCILSS